MEGSSLLAPLSELWATPFAAQLATAIFCGGLIGFERQIRGKAIGIRTSILICMGTQIFVRLGAELGSQGADPARVLGQVVTGVGFLGAGVIMARGGAIIGVTSAAVVWMLAAIGSTIGLGRLAEAVAVSLLVVAILIGVRLFENVYKRLSSDDEQRDASLREPDA